MPVITIHALSPGEPGRIERCLETVAAAVAAAVGRAPDQVWVYWCAVEQAWVGGGLRGFRGHCPVVTVRAREGRPAQAKALALEAAAQAVAQALELPLEDVWVHWVDVPEGLVYAGGALR